MKKNIRFCCCLMAFTISPVIALFCIAGALPALAQESNQDTGFSNTISVEHSSGILYNDIRTEHKTLMDKPSLCLNEKFQVFFPFSSIDEYYMDYCCLPFPELAYVAFNIVYSHDENFAIRAGGEIEFGSGTYRNPFVSFGFGLTSMHDMVFDYSPSMFPTCFFNIGYRHDMHLFLEAAGNQLVFADANLDYRNYNTIDISLGYKKVLPLFLRLTLFSTETAAYYINREEQLIHNNRIYSIHIQYYGDKYGVSGGYKNDREEFIKTSYVTSADKQRVGYRQSHGGGLTFYIMTADSSVEVSGEFHMLSDSSMTWNTISKLGVKVNF